MFRKKFLSMVLLTGMLISQSVPKALAATYCDQAQFVSDLTAPDGSSFAPGAGIYQDLAADEYRHLHLDDFLHSGVGGRRFRRRACSVKLPVAVAPGQMVDISLNLTAPMPAGHYKGLFKISNASGIPFGIGESASDPFWVDINVVETNTVDLRFHHNRAVCTVEERRRDHPLPRHQWR